MSTTNDLAGRVAVVTGAAQGIGRAYARAFADARANAVIVDRSREKANAAVAEIVAAGGIARAIVADIADPDQVAAMVDEVVTVYGRLDVLVNNAALYTTLARHRFDEIPLDEWDQVLRVNVTGTYLCARAAVKPMRSQRYGRIINISSNTVTLGRPYLLHYVTSKAAVVGMTRAMARELGADGITVNAVLPGLTATEVENPGLTDTVREAIIALQCVPRAEVPADLTGLVLFLASEASRFITGQSILVDGGAAHL